LLNKEESETEKTSIAVINDNEETSQNNKDLHSEKNKLDLEKRLKNIPIEGTAPTVEVLVKNYIVLAAYSQGLKYFLSLAIIQLILCQDILLIQNKRGIHQYQAYVFLLCLDVDFFSSRRPSTPSFLNFLPEQSLT
jgi:hypothetical protein